MMEINIIYEDDFLLVINKPHGLVVNKSLTSPINTLQDWLQKRYTFFSKEPDISSDFYNRSGIVHRLDKDTSGLMIIAKNKDVFINLQRQFKNRIIEKEYIALTYLELKFRSGDITVPIGRAPSNRRLFTVLANGREAITSFELIKIFNINNHIYSLVKVKPLTGRTHQIRVHLKYIGHPIVGDVLYTNKQMLIKSNKFCSRLFLHCNFLKFTHPISNKYHSFISELPIELKKIIAFNE